MLSEINARVGLTERAGFRLIVALEGNRRRAGAGAAAAKEHARDGSDDRNGATSRWGRPEPRVSRYGFRLGRQSRFGLSVRRRALSYLGFPTSGNGRAGSLSQAYAPLARAAGRLRNTCQLGGSHCCRRSSRKYVQPHTAAEPLGVSELGAAAEAAKRHCVLVWSSPVLVLRKPMKSYEGGPP